MPIDRFFIAPFDQNSGQQDDVKPWLIPDEAFERLTNAYVFRGRVRKRFGSRWLGNTSFLSRLRIVLGVTVGGGLAGNVRTINLDAGMPTAVGQAFSIGDGTTDTIFTVVNPAGGPQQMLRSDGSLAPATYDLTSSAFNITASGYPDGSTVYFYPALPVMGLLTYEAVSINDEITIGFDTRYAYQYINGWVRIPNETTPGAAVWTGDNSQFFWADTWSGTNAADKVFFVTNFKETEPNFMRYFFAGAWNNFRPLITAAPNPLTYLNSARILVVFKNRLIALNTWEGAASPGINYSNRVRWSQVGSPLDITAWQQDIPGKGNALDASTSEAIVTVEFVKDRLIVFFERSTWELVYTGNQAYPFTWQKINTELGAESTFSIVPFDKVCIGVGNVGIHACNGSNVDRIDQKIPNTVFDIHNNDEGVARVYGIRDYYVEMIYWTFPNTEAMTDFPYPNRVLIYNYKTGTWAFNDDSITVFGYFQPSSAVNWDSTTITWDDDVSWDSGSLQAQFRQVIAGNQEGYTFICDADVPTNASVLQVTNLVSINNLVTVTAIDHNMRWQQYVFFEGITSDATLDLINNGIFQVVNVIDKDNFTFIYTDPAMTILSGTYSGGGLIARVNNIIVKTKQYNFYAKQGRNAYVSKVDFLVDATSAGQTQVQYFVSTSLTPLLQDGAANGSLIGTGTLETFPYTVANIPGGAPVPFEADATRLWHPLYLQSDGECIQLQLTMNDAQMRDVRIRRSGFQLHAMCIYAQPTSYGFR